MNNNSYRQKLHLEPPQGWMNDPNGLSYFDNKYHVYFQYSPSGELREVLFHLHKPHRD
jgi:beta-fructofuranosidase